MSETTRTLTALINDRLSRALRALPALVGAMFFCAAIAAQAAPPDVSTVPVNPLDPVEPHDVIVGKPTTLKGAVDAASVGATWTWDPGDGSPSVSGTVDPAATSITQMDDVGFTPYYAIWIEHTYTGTPEDIVLATLTVDNGVDAPQSAVYRIRLRAPTITNEVNAAIDEALWFMHRNMYRFNGSPVQSHGSFTGGPIPMGGWNFVQYSGEIQASSSAAAINAFEANGYLPNGPASSPYTETVQRGLKFVIAKLTSQSIFPQTVARGGIIDDPDSNGNDLGVYVFGSVPPYQGGMVMDAIIASGTPNAVADTGRAGVIGRSYRDIVQDMVDWYAWAQSDSTAHGGWVYGPYNNSTGGHDNSASGWAAIGLVAAEDIWGIPVPQWVKDRNAVGLEFTDTESDTDEYICCGNDRGDGSHGYRNPTPAWGPFSTTAAAMVQMTLDDIASTSSATPDERWIRSENFFRRHWNLPATGNNFKNYYYAMFNFAKAMRTAVPAEVVLIGANNSVGCGPGGGTPGCSDELAPLDWYLDPDIGLARTVMNYQAQSGPNIGLFNSRPGNSQGSRQDEHITPWATQILTRTLFQAGPVARAAASPNPGASGSPILFDGSQSFHQDPARSLVSYEWDFDNDGTFDATGIFATFSFDCPTLPVPCEFPVRLRVTDNNVPARFSDGIVVVEITIPPRPPVAKSGGPYLACASEEFTLDGSDSFDVDEGTSESGEPPFDTITAYNWELDGISPFDFDEASGVSPTVVFPVQGSRDIGLRVTDNTALAFPTAEQPNLSDNDFSSLTIGDCGCIGPISARTKPGKAQLVWAPVAGAASYDILRSEVGSARQLETIAAEHETDYATYLDRNVVNGTTYWYRVVPKGADGMPICDFSRAVAATPQESRRARPDIVAVPDVVGQQQSDAETVLLNAGLAVGNLTFANSDSIAAGAVVSTSPAAGNSAVEGSAVDLVISLGPVRVEVPGIVGLSQAAAETAIADAGLNVGDVTTANSDTVPAGNVISQDPLGAVEVVLGSAVSFVVSLGPVTVAVPDVVGLEQSLAESAISGAGLSVGAIGSANSDTVPAGDVISQEPLAGTNVVLGTNVSLIVSLGPVTVPVPAVIGLAQADAEAAIIAADLTVGNVTTQNSTTVDAGDVINQSPGAGSNVIPGTAVDLVVSLGPVQVVVPDIVGQSEADAIAALTAADLGTGTITEQNSLAVPAGQVISQDPSAGTTVDESSLVSFVVSLGPVQVSVPDVTGLAQGAAEAAIVAADLVVGSVSSAHSLSVPEGDVISQNPTGGTVVDEQSSVDFVVSLGPLQVVVPNVLDQPEATAVAAITGASLTVGTISTANSTTVAAGNVISQDPAPGTTVDEASAVDIIVSLGPVQVVVPDVVGLAQGTAEATISGAGLAVGGVSTANSDTVPIGDVISQNPAAGVTVDEGTAVSLVVSIGDLLGVPDVIGLPQADAEAAIVAAGLSVGTVTTANSASVPAGSVISQDPAPASAAPPGSPVDLVVSLGPVQVVVPDVTGLTQAAAEAALAAAGLTTGTVSTGVSATAPEGEVIDQDPPGGATVDEGSAVDLVLSDGGAGLEPAALSLSLSSSAITAGGSVSIVPTVLNGVGDPIDPGPAVSYSIALETSEGPAGTLPTESGAVVSTSADTRGLYTVTGTIDGTVITGSAEFLVYRPAAESGQKALYSGLSSSVNGISDAAATLVDALDTGDISTVQSALDAMRSARDGVNLFAMQRTTVFAPETGFLPSTSQLTAAGFAATADDAALKPLLSAIIAKMEETTAFYESLNAASGTDDDAALAALNAELQTLLDQLNALNPTVHGWVAASGKVNLLYAITIPRHLHAVVNRYETAIVNAGIGVVDISTPDSFYRQMISPQPQRSTERLGPEEFYARQQQAFFSLAGMSVAVNIQMSIVKNVYGPILHDLARSVAILAANDLLNSFLNNLGSPDLITGSSLSFHIFNAGGSVIEISGINPDDPERSDVWLVGSSALAAVEGLLTSLDPSGIESLDDVWEFFEGIVDAIEGVGDAAETANQMADSIFPSCLFSGNFNCKQLVYNSGFESVIECSGFFCFAQPVLVLVHNLDTGTWNWGIFNFLP